MLPLWDFHFDERGPLGTLEFIVGFVLIFLISLSNNFVISNSDFNFSGVRVFLFISKDFIIDSSCDLIAFIFLFFRPASLSVDFTLFLSKHQFLLLTFKLQKTLVLLLLI